MFFLYIFLFLCYICYGDDMKNGFTLIELIAVIVILAIVAIITTPVVLNTVEASKTKLNETQKLAVENAAREWALKNLSINASNKAVNSSNTEVKYITIKSLQDAHYLDNKTSLEKIKISDLTKAGVCIKVKISGGEFIGFSYQYKDNVTGSNCS